MKNILGNNLGYLGKFTEWLFVDNTKLSYLKTIYEFIKRVGLDKPIDKFTSAENLYDYLTKKEIDTKTKQVIKSLPSRTRKLVNQELKDLISNNSKYIKAIKDFYSKKGGRYKTIDKLIEDTNNLLDNLGGEWNVDGIKYLDKELVYKDDTTLILHVDSYKRSCILRSQHWCISTDEGNWRKYTENFNKQYFIYDFTKKRSDKESMLGVTILPNGNIEAAHYKDDKEIKDYKILDEYKQYLKPISKEYILSKIDSDNVALMITYGFIDEVKETKEYKWLVNYFKDLTYRYEKEEGGLETWFDKDGQWTIEIWEEKWKYTYIYYKNWNFLGDKYNLKNKQTSELISAMLELILKRKVSEPSRTVHMPRYF